MHSHTRSISVLLSITLTCAGTAKADFEAIPLTNSYNHDVVVEKTAPPPAVSVTTASMEQGLSNSGFSWFERGYIPDWPATGLPEAGSILTSDQSPDYQYQMPPSYQTNNAFLIDSMLSTAIVSISKPTNCGALSFLTSSGMAPNVIRYTVRRQDGSSESGTFTSPNWYNDGDPAWATSGKVNVTSFTHADLTSYNPRLYSADVALSGASSPIDQIELSLASGNGHTAIFAVSGARFQSGVFVPLSISGYNADLIVEASAIKPGFLETNTTATMDQGTNNSGSTWYERGYNPAAPGSGLPAAGALITSESDARHHFLMPPNYAQPNSVLIDSFGPDPVLTLVTPACYSAMSFLTASCGGAVTALCVIRHADGHAETNSFVSPDWLDSSAGALTAGGRVSVGTRLIDKQNSEFPKLYAVDVPIVEQTSPVTKLTVSRIGTAGRIIIFALAGAPTNTSHPDRAVLSISCESSGKINFYTTQAGRLESCANLEGIQTNWRDEGPISQTLSLMRSSDEPLRFYRVVGR